MARARKPSGHKPRHGKTLMIGKMLSLGLLWSMVACLAAAVTVMLGLRGELMGAVKMLFAFFMSIAACIFFIRSNRGSRDKEELEGGQPSIRANLLGSAYLFGFGIVISGFGLLSLPIIALTIKAEPIFERLQFTFMGAFLTALGLSMLLNSRADERRQALRKREKFKANPSLHLPP
ncbi:MAG: hypothetical protein JNK23_20430 [Opitutaceae bacterium]|nr:hypothetical protein [Opitutaceae bacterium]